MDRNLLKILNKRQIKINNLLYENELINEANNISILNEINKKQKEIKDNEIYIVTSLRKLFKEEENETNNEQDEIDMQIFNSEKQYIKIDRIQSCRTIIEIIEYLNYYKELENEEYYFDLQIRLSNEYSVPWERGFRTKVIKQKTIEELIDYLEDWIDDLHERYGDEREDQEVVQDVFLKKVNPWYGEGKKYSLFKIINNRPYNIKFENTAHQCLIKSVINYLNLSNNDYHNFSREYGKKKDMSFLELKNKIEIKYDIKIKITSSLKKLEKLIKNKNKNDVILFASGNHLGAVIKELPHIKPNKDEKEKSKTFVKKSEIIYGTFDSEWEWIKIEDGKYIAKDPGIITFKFIDNNKETEKAFPSFKNFMSYLDALSRAKDKNVYLYSHNGKKIEHQYVIKELIARYTRRKKNPTIKLTNIAGNSIKSFRWKIGTNFINFIDTTLFMKMSLDEIAKTFNTKNKIKKHAKMDPDNQEEFFINKKWDFNNTDDIEYCMNDTRILLEFIDSFNKLVAEILKYDNPEDNLYIYKSSISAINKTMIFNNFSHLINNHEQSSLFMESLMGGRTEMFFRGKVKIPKGFQLRMIDLKSAYPYIMLIKKFHGKYIGILEKIPSEKAMIKNNIRWMMFCSVKYKKGFRYPPLGKKLLGRTIFPNILNSYDKRFLFDFEYYELKDQIDIKNVYEIYGFESQNFPFIADMFAMKENSKHSKSLYTSNKVLLNGCFGSLCLNLRRSFKEIVPTATIEEGIITDDNEFQFNEIDDIYSWLQLKHFIDSPVCVQAASSITAQVRMILWKKIMELHSNGCDILYCDTDSIYFVCPEDYPNEENNKIIGSWDEEIKESMTIFGLKAYICDKKNTIKGMIDSNIEIDEDDVLENGLCYTNKEWRVVNGEIIMNEIDKFTDFNYTKGIVNENGYVTPLTI